METWGVSLAWKQAKSLETRFFRRKWGEGGVRGYALAEAYEQMRYGVIVNIFMQLGRAKRSQWGS